MYLVCISSSGKGVLCPNTISPVSETARPGRKIQSLNVLSSQDRWLRLKMAASQDGCVSRHSTQSQDGVSCDMENVSQDTTTSQDASIKSQYGGTSRHAISPWEDSAVSGRSNLCWDIDPLSQTTPHPRNMRLSVLVGSVESASASGEKASFWR